MIKKMQKADANKIIEMMRVFYASPAVLSDGSDEIFAADIENCVNDCPYLEGYVFTEGETVCGYAMIAKSFSTEFGKPCIWIEDLYVTPEYRGIGLGTQFLEFAEKEYSGCVFRLEVESDNARAMHVYKNCGYEILPYTEMKKER